MNNWLPILASFSILNHSKYYESYRGKRAIQWIDRAIAHKIAARSFLNAWAIRHKPTPWLYSYFGCFFYTVMVYYGIVRRETKINWHASMHLISSIGSMCLYNHRKRFILGQATK